jgi:hypothetical protein
LSLLSWSILNLGFLTEGRLAAILIIPSSWGSQRAGYHHAQGQSAPTSTWSPSVIFWRHQPVANTIEETTPKKSTTKKTTEDKTPKKSNTKKTTEENIPKISTTKKTIEENTPKMSTTKKTTKNTPKKSYTKKITPKKCTNN